MQSQGYLPSPPKTPSLCVNTYIINVKAKRSSSPTTSNLRIAVLSTPLVASLVTLVGDSPAAVAVHVVPDAQPYPPGQQPPLRLAAQVFQPEAQLPFPNPAVAGPIPLPVGATIVTPLVFAIVVEAEAGQSESAQSRPTRQQPP